MSFLPFDDELTTVTHLAAGLLPEIGDVAAAMGADRRFAARAAAIKLYQAGWRTSTIGDLRIACRVDNPIPAPLDDDPGPGISVHEHGRAA